MIRPQDVGGGAQEYTPTSGENRPSAPLNVDVLFEMLEALTKRVEDLEN